MYRLTNRRLEAARPILDEYQTRLFSHQSFDAQALEYELREVWGIGYQELKDVAADMVKQDRYREVALFYMERSNPGTGVAAEFKPVLAKAYGVRSYDQPDRDAKREAFWADVFGRGPAA